MPLLQEETGLNYAQRGQIDQPTLYGLQEIVRKMAIEWHGFKDEDKTAENVEKTLINMADNNAYIKASGTAEMVKRYFSYVKKQAGDEAVKNFLNAIRLEEATKLSDTVDNLSREGKGSTISDFSLINNLRVAAKPFDEALENHLKIEKLEQSYTGFLKQNLEHDKEKLAEIIIRRSSLMDEQIKNVQMVIGTLKSVSDLNPFKLLSKSKIADFDPQDWKKGMPESGPPINSGQREKLMVEIPKNIPPKRNSAGNGSSVGNDARR